MATSIRPAHLEPDMEQARAQARILGRNRALSEMAASWQGPTESPLSGEWADDPVEATLARSLGIPAPTVLTHNEDGCEQCTKYGIEFDVYAERAMDVGHAYEDAYFEAWTEGL